MPVIAKLNVANENIEQLDIDNIKSSNIWGPGPSKSLLGDLQKYLAISKELISIPDNEMLVSVQKKTSGRILIAFSDSRSKTIHVLSYKASNKELQKVYPILRDDMHQKSIYCMQWGFYCDFLFVGTVGGTCIWSIHKEGPVMNFLAHPYGKEIHEIAVSPHDRMFATLTREDNAIYIWDAHMGNYSSIYCMMGSRAYGSLSWSPSGNLITLMNTAYDIIMINTTNWSWRSCGQISQGIDTNCWVQDDTWMYICNAKISIVKFQIDTSEIDLTSHSHSFYDFDFTPIISYVKTNRLIDTKDVTHLHINIKIDSIKANVSQKYLAITFALKGLNKKSYKLPIAALYMYQTSPLLSLIFIRIISYECPKNEVENQQEDRNQLVAFDFLGLEQSFIESNLINKNAASDCNLCNIVAYGKENETNIEVHFEKTLI